jgi:hypothetical protein
VAKHLFFMALWYMVAFLVLLALVSAPTSVELNPGTHEADAGLYIENDPTSVDDTFPYQFDLPN